jgi:hypothetical protein
MIAFRECFRSAASYGGESTFWIEACQVDAAALRGTRLERTRISLEIRGLTDIKSNAAFRRFSKGEEVKWVDPPNT